MGSRSKQPFATDIAAAAPTAEPCAKPSKVPANNNNRSNKHQPNLAFTKVITTTTTTAAPSFHSPSLPSSPSTSDIDAAPPTDAALTALFTRFNDRLEQLHARVAASAALPTNDITTTATTAAGAAATFLAAVATAVHPNKKTVAAQEAHKDARREAAARRAEAEREEWEEQQDGRSGVVSGRWMQRSGNMRQQGKEEAEGCRKRKRDDRRGARDEEVEKEKTRTRHDGKKITLEKDREEGASGRPHALHMETSTRVHPAVLAALAGSNGRGRHENVGAAEGDLAETEKQQRVTLQVETEAEAKDEGGENTEGEGITKKKKAKNNKKKKKKKKKKTKTKTIDETACSNVERGDDGAGRIEEGVGEREYVRVDSSDDKDDDPQ